MTVGSLRDRRVQAFLAVEAISATGTWATMIVIWGYAAYAFDASAADVAVFGVALTVPGVIMGPLTGTLIDRFGPRATLMGAKLLGTGASLALLAADDYRSLTLLSFVHGVVNAVTHPALQSLPPRLVADDELARTNALVSLTDEFAIVAGPVVGAVSIAAFGFRGAFVVDAATYALGLVVLPLVRLRDVPTAAELPGIRQALDGLKVVGVDPVLRRVVAASAAVHLLYGAAVLAEPLYVRDVLGRSPDVFAALQVVFGICLVGGGLLVARVGDRVTSFGWVALGVGVSGLTAALYLGTPYLPIAFIGVALWGLFTALLSGPTRTLLQRRSDPAMHGRVMATDFLGANLAELIGLASAGVLVELFGVSSALTGMGLAVAVGAVFLQRSHRRASTGAAVAAPAGL